MAVVDPAADHVAEEGFDQLVKALIESGTHGLPGQIGAGGFADSSGQIIVAWGTGRALGQHRANKISGRDLPGPAFDET